MKSKSMILKRLVTIYDQLLLLNKERDRLLKELAKMQPHRHANGQITVLVDAWLESQGAAIFKATDIDVVALERRSTVSRYLHRLVAKDRLVKVSHGKFQLPVQESADT